MRMFCSFLILVMAVVATVSTASERSSNYPLYKLNNVVAQEVSEDGKTLLTIEATDEGRTFVGRDLVSGEVLLTAPLDLPDAGFTNTVIVGEDVYVFQLKILDRKKRLAETYIYKINSATGQMETVYVSQEVRGIAEKFYATKEGLLLTEKRGGNPFLVDYKTYEMVAINLENDMRIRSFDFERNTAIIIKQTNFSTYFKGEGDDSSYTEGDGSLLDVYVCDFSADYALTKVGQYQPSYVLTKNAEDGFLPHFIIEDSEYSWVGPSFMVNRYPVFPGGLLGDTSLYNTWQSLVGFESITDISLVDENYAIGRQFSETGDVLLVVYDLKNPILTKEETVSKEDRDRIKALLTANTVTEKTLLDPETMSRVFAARFYDIKMVTTVVDSSDEGTMTMSSTESFLAVGFNDEYSVIKQNEELVPFLNDDFVLNEQNAPLFQDALDLLFPLGHFAQKHKMFYKENDRWIFVRDESFGEKVGIVVNVDGAGKVIGILNEGELLKLD